MARKPSAKTIPPAPTTPPKLIVPRSQAQQRLEAHIEKGREIVNRPMNSQVEMDTAKADGEKWRDYAIRLLPTLFDSMSVADDYENKTRGIAIAGGDTSYIKEREIFKPWMNYRIRELESILESLELFDESPPSLGTPQRHAFTDNTAKDPQVDALEKIELITKRFKFIARQLRDRHSARPPFTISDEYDVQDLFHALLRLFFDDIRDEEWTPSYAGGHSRIDFLLKAEQIVIEIKMTRQGLKAKEVSDQLIIDIGRYRAHPDCKVLIAFVYDPELYINNPKGVEHDLSRLTDGMLVKVIIAPS